MCVNKKMSKTKATMLFLLLSLSAVKQNSVTPFVLLPGILFYCTVYKVKTNIPTFKILFLVSEQNVAKSKCYFKFVL